MSTSLRARRLGIHTRSLPRDAILALLALGASLWLPAVLAASGWLPSEPAGLYALEKVGRRAVLLGLVAGAQFTARILPPLPMVAGDLARVASWLWHLAEDGTPGPDLPLSYSAGHLYWQTRGLLERLGLWAYNLRQGTPNTDNTALLFATAVGVWLLAHNATHELVARQRAFAGLLPVAAAVEGDAAAARAATWQTPARLRSAITTPSCRCSTPMAMCCGHISSGRTSMTMCSAWPSQPMGGCSPSA